MAEKTSQPSHGPNESYGPLLSLAELRDAYERIRPVLRPTPVRSADSLSRFVGRALIIKPEYLQRTGSFKIRGAYNHISRLSATTEVVAASAGNHAQGVALAAAQCGLTATVFMPDGAPLPKVEATRAYGAQIRPGGAGIHDCLAAAQAYAAERGATLVPPFDDRLVIAGQGTIGLELIDEAPQAEVVLIPVGGGGLLAGIGAALSLGMVGSRSTRSPGSPGLPGSPGSLRRPRIIGVEAQGAAPLVAALAAGRVVTLDQAATMADGIAVRAVSELTLAHAQAFVDEVVTVTEEEISEALVLLLERAKAVVEPAGAVGLAALLAGRITGTGPVAIVLSGGNVDPLLLIKLIEHGLSAAGRYVLLRIVLDDRPGSLAHLTAAVADMGLNVLEVTHRRAGRDLALDTVEVVLTLETRDRRHGSAIAADLRHAGFSVDSLG